MRYIKGCQIKKEAVSPKQKAHYFPQHTAVLQDSDAKILYHLYPHFARGSDEITERI